ncbi:helix-turn-helix transcriptional regulator [Actinoallomurus purpureus]|uniref:helix-turn-helix domain-containing protein n=1 Tax=Actinoallomurus purpureus TaxID=478114 RepID=UPI0020930248|nr:helix-turn-helix transcriptional regulator [Actinoallomurus purpureus]MCO6005866.1 helix-turn-helix transcriptional regulator [Actinoallomurus purpureus]
MNRGSDLDPKESLSHLLAYYLRKYRESASLTQLELARKLHVGESHLGNLERGRRRITIDQAKEADNVFNLPGWFENLHHHAQRQHRDWLEQYAALEAETSDIKTWQPLWLPGLLQTLAYAKASLGSSRAEDIEARAEARLQRQHVLDRDKPPRLWILIDEKALLQGVGGHKAMREQIEHLLVLAERPSVTLQIVPARAGSHAGLDGGFNVLTTEEGDVGFVEAPLGGRLIQDEQEVRKLLRRWDDIRSLALPVTETREKLLSILKGLNEG